MTLAGGKVPAPGRRVTGDETTTELVFSVRTEMLVTTAGFDIFRVVPVGESITKHK